MNKYAKKIGTKDKPLELKTPPGTGTYTMHLDDIDGNEVLVCTVGKPFYITIQDVSMISRQC